MSADLVAVHRISKQPRHRHGRDAAAARGARDALVGCDHLGRVVRAARLVLVETDQIVPRREGAVLPVERRPVVEACGMFDREKGRGGNKRASTQVSIPSREPTNNPRQPATRLSSTYRCWWVGSSAPSVSGTSQCLRTWAPSPPSRRQRTLTD